jgi:hypothetical protein
MVCKHVGMDGDVGPLVVGSLSEKIRIQCVKHQQEVGKINNAWYRTVYICLMKVSFCVSYSLLGAVNSQSPSFEFFGSRHSRGRIRERYRSDIEMNDIWFLALLCGFLLIIDLP